MQTQEDHSNPIPALNVDSLKVDLVVIQNTCSEKEDSNLETASSKSVKESSLNSATKYVHAIKYKMSQAKERCIYFRSLHSYLQVFSKKYFKGTRIEHGFKRAFMSLFGQDADTFTSTMLLNVDQLQKQLDKDEFQEDGSMAAFWVVNNQFYKFIDSQFSVDYDSQMSDKYFVEYTGIEYDRRVNKRQLQTQESKIDTGTTVDADLVVTESSGTESEVQDDSSRSWNDIDSDGADIRPIYDEELMAKVQLTAKCNIFTIGKQHTEQPKIINECRVDQSKTIEQTTSLLANNADLKAQIQEKVFAIFALKNDLKKLKGNITQHYLTKRKESIFAKLDHMIASSESRNSSKNMPIFSLNDMVHNHYLDEARKKTQERDRNSKTSMTPSARFQSTTDGSKPKPRSNNQTPRSFPVSKSSCVTIKVVPKAYHPKISSSFSDSKHFVCSTCHKCVFNANHDACIEKLLKEIFTGHRFSPNKTSAVYEKTSPRSDLRWKPTGRIFKSVGLRWIPIGKLFDFCTGKDNSEHTPGSNVDIPNIHEYKQTLDVSAGTSINFQKEQSLKLCADMIVMKSMIEFGSLFSPLFDEYFNGENQVVSKSSAATTADASDKRQQQHDSTSYTSTLATTVTVDGNFDL
ncbi:hypothetical protein Tco_0271892 [Tanacetum coccineum]